MRNARPITAAITRSCKDRMAHYGNGGVMRRAVAFAQVGGMRNGRNARNAYMRKEFTYAYRARAQGGLFRRMTLPAITRS
jgi:hypothetical protein